MSDREKVEVALAALTSTAETAKILGITENDLKKKWYRGIVEPVCIEKGRAKWDAEQVRAAIIAHTNTKKEKRHAYIERQKQASKRRYHEKKKRITAHTQAETRETPATQAETA